MRSLIPRLREYAAVAAFGWFGTQMVLQIVRVLSDGGARPMYIDPSVFVLMLLGDALSVAGVLIGAVALVAMLWLRRPPRRAAKPQVSGLVRKDGRPL